jgi:hypothetical protein
MEALFLTMVFKSVASAYHKLLKLLLQFTTIYEFGEESSDFFFHTWFA